MLARALIVLFSVLNLGAAVWWIAHDPSVPPAAVQVPPGVAHLQLVNETRMPVPQPAIAAATASRAMDAPAPPAANGITAPPAQQCFSFGPFASNEAGAAAAAKLKPLVQAVAARGEATATASNRGWRVYLPPQSSLAEAQAVAQRIGAAGFGDYLIVREGAEANSIALGRYRGQEAANRRAQALNAAGFAARAEALGGAVAGPVWLDVVADEAFDPRRAQATIAAAQFQKSDCAR